MKKMLLVLAMLVFASPAMAATVAVSLEEVDTHSVEVSYVASANVSGFGLVVSVDAGTIVSVTAEHVGDCNATEKGFGIFPESFAAELDAADPNWGDGNYTPVAPNTAPGAAGTGIGFDTVILEMGALYEDGFAPLTSGVLCTIVVSADCDITVAADATRGNVVMEDTTEASFTGDTITIPSCDYPACWDYATQCNGDSDGDTDVDTLDWPYFRDGFGKVYPAAGYQPCADYDHDGDTDTIDWPKFRDYFGKTAPATCPAVTIPNIYCP